MTTCEVHGINRCTICLADAEAHLSCGGCGLPWCREEPDHEEDPTPTTRVAPVRAAIAARKEEA
jgi:hypothetical protein